VANEPPFNYAGEPSLGVAAGRLVVSYPEAQHSHCAAIAGPSEAATMRIALVSLELDRDEAVFDLWCPGGIIRHQACTMPLCRADCGTGAQVQFRERSI